MEVARLLGLVSCYSSLFKMLGHNKRKSQPSHKKMYLTYLECKVFVEIGTAQDHTSQHEGQSKAHAPAPSPPLPNRHSILRVLQRIREKPRPSTHHSQDTYGSRYFMPSKYKHRIHQKRLHALYHNCLETYFIW